MIKNWLKEKKKKKYLFNIFGNKKKKNKNWIVGKKKKKKKKNKFLTIREPRKPYKFSPFWRKFTTKKIVGPKVTRG